MFQHRPVQPFSCQDGLSSCWSGPPWRVEAATRHQPTKEVQQKIAGELEACLESCFSALPERFNNGDCKKRCCISVRHVRFRDVIGLVHTLKSTTRYYYYSRKYSITFWSLRVFFFYFDMDDGPRLNLCFKYHFDLRQLAQCMYNISERYFRHSVFAPVVRSAVRRSSSLAAWWTVSHSQLVEA